MYASLTSTELLDLNSDELIVLTVNNRFARRVMAELQKHVPSAQGTLALPDIVPVSAWYRQLNDELSFNEDYAPASYLLDRFSSLYVWEQIIYEQETEQAWLIDVPQAAQMALEADMLIDEWDLHITESLHTKDSTRFMQWRQAYKSYLDSYDLDDSNQVMQRVTHALESLVYNLEWKHVVLVGFHSYSARFQRLLNALQDQGVMLYTYSTQVQVVESRTRVAASEPDAEWRLAAQWAAKQLKQHPKGCYAIVDLNLQSQVAFAHRVLAHELAPRSDQDQGYSWNLSVGRALSEWPLVRAALAWLTVIAQAKQGQVQAAQMGSALLAGYCVAMLTEQNERAVIDVQWRKNQYHFLSLEQLQQQLKSCEHLASAWAAAVDYIQQQPLKATPAQWVPHLRQVLQLLGFPGEANLDSHAYQTMVAFDERLAQFARLAPVFGALPLSQMVALLSRFLGDTLFQPQRESGSRLDVLGLLEAEGGHWDGVWVIGVTDDMLPAIPQPNAFIPYQALAQAQAPRSTPERELEWAHHMFNSLQQATPCLIFSYACQDNGQLLRPSPLIAHLKEQAAADPLEQPITKPVPLEILLDEQGPDVDQALPVYGGTALLDAQARNPLWAFVQYRLHAEQLPTYDATAALRLWRGQFLHRVVENMWQAVQPPTRAQLHYARQGDWEQQLHHAIEQAADQCLGQLPRQWRQLECERAFKIMAHWFDFELQRSDFTVVGLEQRHQLTGLNTFMRIDRIDQLANGQYMLMDYKSSKANKNYSKWLRARPIELQLPIYAAIFAEQNKEVAALAFAFLHYQPVLGGYGTAEAGLSETAPKAFESDFNGDWESLKNHLQQQVWAMRDEFLTGTARNYFFDENDLLYCAVRPFLRLNQEFLNE